MSNEAMNMQMESKRILKKRLINVNRQTNDLPDRVLNYVAATDSGPVGLTILKKGEAGGYVSAVESRLELCRIERLLRALEEAIQLPLDPEFVEMDLDTPVSFIAKIPATRPVTRVAVHLPAASWRHYDAAVSRFHTSAYDVTWPVCEARLVLAKLSIPAEELTSLKLNSTVLIPESYQPQWAPKLVFPTMNAQLRGRMELPHLLWITTSEVEPISPADSSAEDPEQTSDLLELEIYSRTSVLSKKCLEGVDSIGYAVNKNLRRHACVLAGLEHAACAGVLMPIGRGTGLHITQYKETAPAMMN